MKLRQTHTTKHQATARLRRALGNKRGETITEVLVAMVIAGLALLMLATVIATSSHIVTNSREYMEEYYESGNELAVVSDGGDMTITTSIKLSPAGSTSIAVKAHVDASDEDNPIVSYEKA